MTYITRLVNPFSFRALQPVEYSISPGHPPIPMRECRTNGMQVVSEDYFTGVGLDPNPL